MNLYYWITKKDYKLENYITLNRNTDFLSFCVGCAIQRERPAGVGGGSGSPACP